MSTFYVYVLKCSDNMIYMGYTSNIENRLQQHQSGKVKFTQHRRPVKLQCYTAFFNKYLALSYEKYLKTGSGRSVLYKRLLGM